MDSFNFWKAELMLVSFHDKMKINKLFDLNVCHYCQY